MSRWSERITNNRYFYHYLFWVIVLLSYFVDAAELRHFDAHLFLHTLVLKNGLLIAIVYLHLRVLIPAFLEPRRYGLYALSLSLTILCGAWLTSRIEFHSWKKLYDTEHQHQRIVHEPEATGPIETGILDALRSDRYLLDALTVCRYLVISLLLKFIDDFFRQREQLQQVQHEKTMAELNVLKSQVNPHFLFNTLNNLYGLILERSDLAAETVLKLADIMKYTLAEGDARQVPLSRDLENLRHYFDLEILRLSDASGVKFNVKGTVSEQRIAPLLLLPLLENAFKHGIHRNRSKPLLEVNIEVSPEAIYFTTSNPMPTDGSLNSLGMGLENVRKRLALLYPDRHKLEWKEAGTHFIVSLFISFK